MSRVLQSDMLPVLPAINGLVNSISVAAVGKNRIDARSYVNDVRIRRRQSHSPDRRDLLLVENRLPDRAPVRRFPHPSAVRPKIVDARIARNPRDGIHLSRAERPDHSPFHFRIERFGNLLRVANSRKQKSRGPKERRTKHNLKRT